jgi:hypothetical protein
MEHSISPLALPGELPGDVAARLGLRLRTSDQMINTQDDRCRPAARNAYNAAIRHFLATGAFGEKQMTDFVHIINPPGANAHAWIAYCEAADNIERWIAGHPDEAAVLKNGGTAPAPDAPESAPVLELAEDSGAGIGPAEEAAVPEGVPPDLAAERLGLPFRGRLQFQSMPKEMWEIASGEYNRTVQEFIETGNAPGMVRADFGHLTDPPGAAEFALKAHRMAQHAIRDWKDQHIPKPAPEKQPEIVESDSECKEHNHTPAAVSVRGELVDLGVSRPKGWNTPKPAAALSVSEEARRIFRQPMPDDETEALLNAIIGEMHFNMREIAFRSMCQVKDLNDRMEWVNATMKMAECGAKVAESVARLRGFEEPDARRRRRSGQQ